ncbi:MauE/DoxX family redox-associated membrane protein [Chryseobacterium geocarposphaerae]|uniref:Methylamine utilization protein MauE n=1 Tax=Chryseobacterium geocarposphaerae TaxID=1416776 RepID=A0A2M9C919_9FLAO|nr:MauE/DoxX family redox-associated membrane protein [Chryseobacterium geocarposphaerae]PJJ67329.1 methylamine utilization protein MauE [Chryseobacterium geocarposphaerae]
MKYLKKIIPFVVSIYFVILFCYAAISKILDFEKFQNQISASPLLNGFSQFLPYTIIIVESFIAGLLCYRKTRTIGLIGSFILMLIFTGYIALLIRTSKNLPCSCGRILEKMSWHQHLYFNIGCVILSLIALGLNLKYSRPAE